QQQQGQTQPQSSQASFNDREDYDDDAYEQAEAAESSSGGDRNQAAAEQGDASSTGEQPPTPQVWNGSEQPAGEAPEGEQPAPQPRRRRRSRVQRQQETSADNTEAGDGADKASGNDTGKPNGATEHVNGGGNSSDGEQAATRGADEKPKRKSAARVKEVESSEDPGPIQLDGPAENTSDPTVV
ncbi:MAG TPA: hypothetical protein VKA18_01600, partial [Alphaproteobacteria bacterium]|nr:hypothetical protein [Alphaproteobacteria bacterium]